MQFSVVFLAILALGAAIPQTPKQQAADQELLRKQQEVIALLENISGPIVNEQLHTLGLTYNIEGNLQNYVNPSTVRYVVGAAQTNNVQPRHTGFSVSQSRLRKEAALLHRILLGAKDYDTFLKTAAWIRVHFNEHQFVKAFTAAVLERQDTQGIILPPPYEVFPLYFFDSRIIQQAQDIKARGIENPAQGNVVHITVNDTSYLPQGENKLAYFTQDIGLAAYYTYVKLAGYLHAEDFGIHSGAGVGAGVGGLSGQNVDVNSHINGRGAHFYYLHQQLLARYNLERLSNGLGPIQTLNLDGEVNIPFKPIQRYTNGLEGPARPTYINLQQQNPQLLQAVHQLQRRIIDAIDSGSVLTPQGVFVSILNPQGLNILGNLIEATGRSINPRYYGNLVAATQQLLGVSPHTTNIWDYTPSALEISETAVKDPAFYQLFKMVLNLFQQYQEGLPHHVYNDVVLPGVTVEKVIASPLVTYFGDFSVSLDNAVIGPVGEQEQNPVKVRAQLKRLDHHPYELQIVVQSDKTIQNAVVRVFVGPKYNHEGQHIDINTDRLSFVELDQFVTDLVEGQNVIVRNSQQASGQSWDWPSIRAIKDSVDAAIKSQNPFYITEPQQIFGFPARLSLPKGTQSGLPLQLLVVISGQEQTVPQSYAGIVPTQWQSYNSESFQIVEEEEYSQHATVPVNNVGPINTCTPAIAVVPHYNQKTSVPAAKWHYGYLYKHWPGHQSFPRWQQHHYQQGEGEGNHHLGLLNGGLATLGQVGLGQVTGLGQGGGIPQYLQQHVVGGMGVNQQGVAGQQGVSGPQVVGHIPVEGQAGPIVGPSIVRQGLNIHGQIPQTGGVQLGVNEQTNIHPRFHGQIGIGQGVGGLHGGIGQGVTGGLGGLGGLNHQGVGVGGVYGGVGGVHTGVHGIHGGMHSGSHTGVHGIGGHHGNGHYPVQHGHVHGSQTHDETLYQYYNSQPISNVIGGAISLDGKPLGWPLDRPLDNSALYAPNIHISDVVVHHVDYPVNPVNGQEIYA